MTKVAPYWKAVVAIVLAGVTAVAAAITDGTITDEEWRAIGGAVVTAFLVWLVPNKPEPPA